MKFFSVFGCCVSVSMFLLGCDSSGGLIVKAEEVSRPTESRPLSSTQINVFDDTIATAKHAPLVSPLGSTNLFHNPGFESGLDGWNSCASSPLTLTSDTYQGTQALEIRANDCVYQSVQIEAGGTYVLSCEVKLTSTKAWTGMGLVFANADYVSLLNAPIAQATAGEYTTLVTKGIAPKGTSFASMWVHSDHGALVDNCSLILEENQLPTIPDEGNLLDNSSFGSIDVEGDLENWVSGCGGGVRSLDTSVSLQDGACLDQSLNVVAIESIKNSDTKFGCYVTGSNGYSDLSVFIDGKLAATKPIPPTQSTTYVSVDVDATTASNGFVTLYSDDSLSVAACTLDTVKTTTSEPSAPVDEGATPVVFGSTKLELFVKRRLSIMDRPITRDDMLQLTSLYDSTSTTSVAVSIGIDSLTGLEHALNLETIFLPESSIDSIAPLRHLSKLQQVTIATVPEFSDISVFAEQEFPELLYVRFFGRSSISDLTPLSGYNLQRISVENGLVTDPSPVANMNLRYLTLTGSKLTNLQSLADGPGFYYRHSIFRLSAEGLDLSDNSPDRMALQNIESRVAGAPAIRLTLSNGDTLYLDGTRTSSGGTVSPTIPRPDLPEGTTPVVFGSAKLEELVKSKLSIADRQVTIDDLLFLTNLSIDSDSDFVGIESLTGLEYAYNLSVLSLQRSSIDSLTPLKYLRALKEISLSTVPEFNDISVFAEHEFPNLSVLRFYGQSSISDLTPLSGYDISRFSIENGKVTDVTPIADMNFFILTLTGSTLTNLQALADGPGFTAVISNFNLSSEGLDLSENSPDLIALQSIENKVLGRSNVHLQLPNGDRVDLEAR